MKFNIKILTNIDLISSTGNYPIEIEDNKFNSKTGEEVHYNAIRYIMEKGIYDGIIPPKGKRYIINDNIHTSIDNYLSFLRGM